MSTERRKQLKTMHGPLIASALFAFLVVVILFATAHWWGKWLAVFYRRVRLNLTIAGRYLGDVVKAAFGQGQTRPPGPSKSRGGNL